MTATVGLDRETLDMMLDSLDEFVAAALPDERRRELDHEDICPEETIRAMCGDDLGVHLVFIPEEWAAGRSTRIGFANDLRASTSGSRHRCSPRFSAPTRF
ncbi:hypothetical protein [Mycobacterium sp.]|uniref:hypothetical protein n=1 Tax=Mycobacterium sp. TaxID=1785 RepID=UPI003C70EF96